jgi:carotenoid 1,2-hydratase
MTPGALVPVTPVPPGPLDRSYLDIPGAFLWWYIDLVDDQGRGVVLIASWGLPFLPGLLDAARRGSPVPPRERPALVLSVYGDTGFYTLDVPAEAAWESLPDGERLTLGRSVITLQWGTGDDDVPGAVPAGFLRVDATIDADGAGEPITGTLQVTGRSVATEAAAPEHGWSLLTAGTTGNAELQFGDTTLRIDGRAYVDRNAGRRPMDQLGMAAWTWARVAFPTGDLVIWDVDPTGGHDGQAIALWVGADGQRRESTPSYRRSGWQLAGGVGAPRQLELAVDDQTFTLDFGVPFESAPFYARFPVTATSSDGATGRGVGERCRPDRIDAAWMRPFVRMCVQEPDYRSIWLPLFAGPTAGRAGRLVRSWVAR